MGKKKKARADRKDLGGAIANSPAGLPSADTSQKTIENFVLSI